MMINNSKALELYVHIPFCVKKCNYCDFLSFNATEEVKEKYVDILINEIKTKSSDYKSYNVTSVFIGGGTPSILGSKQITDIISTIRLYYDVANDVEITIEVNPGTVDYDKLLTYKNASISRLSIGLQSALNDELRVLGRIHTYEEFENSFKLARKAGFNNINIDIIGSLPGQTKDKFLYTLNKVIELNPEHISSYELIIEEGTPFYLRYGNDRSNLPDEDTEREIYYLTREMLENNGYIQYEISNYAKNGFECRHNIGYWTGTEYIGLGLGASSYFNNTRYKNVSNIEAYLNGDFNKYELEELGSDDLMSEFMILGLRMNRGVSSDEFNIRFGKTIDEVYGKTIKKMTSLNLLKAENEYLYLTKKGMDVANYVMSEFC